MKEAARYYVELIHQGALIDILDVGGGLGIDYEGTCSRHYCSMNYSMQEYANKIVHTIAEVCKEYHITQPHIFTESGRAMTAHHAVLLTNIIDTENCQSALLDFSSEAQHPTLIHDLWKTHENLTSRNALESYHDASYSLKEAQSLFSHGVLTLAERALAEELFTAICMKIRDLLSVEQRSHRELLDYLNQRLAEKWFVNFSLFQSLPDVWAIDQIFPIMPLTHLDQPPIKRARLQDITCDSDGQVKYYVDGQGVETSLPLPDLPVKEQTACLALFLVGAYQEILGDMHNLFGDTDSVHVTQAADGRYELRNAIKGNKVSDVLRYVNFDNDALLQAYQVQLERADLPSMAKTAYFDELRQGLEGYTYLE
jgi:arginine decarboxylase